MTDVETTYYLPLYGMKLDSNLVGFLGSGEVGISKPYPDEWRHINRSDVWMEMVGNNVSLFHSEEDIPPCLTLRFSCGADEPPEHFFGRNYNEFRRQVEIPLLSLRLYKAGFFFSPQLAQQILSSTNAMVSREPGPYRQFFMDYHTDFFGDGYKLSIKELIQNSGDNPPLNQIYLLLLDTVDQEPGFLDSIPVRNFILSHSLFTRATHRCAALFTCLEGLLATNEFLDGNHGKSRIHYAERLRRMLEIAGVKDAVARSRWFDDHKGGARFLRNNIAHGNQRAIMELAERTVGELQEMVRIILKEYIIYLAMTAERDENDRAKEYSANDAMLSFNIAIESFINGNAQDKDFEHDLRFNYESLHPVV